MSDNLTIEKKKKKKLDKKVVWFSIKPTMLKHKLGTSKRNQFQSKAAGNGSVIVQVGHNTVLSICSMRSVFTYGEAL